MLTRRRVDPMLPIDRIEPFDPIDSSESSDQRDHRDVEVRTSGILDAVARPGNCSRLDAARFGNTINTVLTGRCGSRGRRQVRGAPRRDRRRFAAAAMALCCAGLIAFAPAASGAGTFSVVASPNPTGSTGSHLNGVSCVSASNCTAVGYYATSSSPGRTLVERWNGTTWSIIPSPNPTGSTGGYLNSVSCVSASNCTAVGYYTTASSPGRTLVERWNGTKWSIIPSPNATGSIGSYLNAVSCTAATSCAAVGYSYNSTATKTLAARWNGTNWAVSASPNPSGDDPALFSVSCASATNCLAVGNYTSTSGSDATLAERWNGTKWSIVASPTPKGSDSYLNAVSCASGTYCIAVGSTYPATGPGRTLVERWNGSAWAIVSSPSPAGVNESWLSGVRCRSATTCTAVGASSATSDKTLVERWNGSAWVIVASPNPTESTASYLNDVSCVTATACTAVGDWRGSSPYRTLIERST